MNECYSRNARIMEQACIIFIKDRAHLHTARPGCASLQMWRLIKHGDLRSRL